MKKLAGAVVVIALLVAVVVAAQEGKPPFDNPKDKTSYALGVNIGNGMKQQGFDINPQILAKGLADAYAGSKTLLTEQEVHEVLATFQKEMVAKMQEHQKAEAEKNKKAGEEFLAANKTKEGIVTTASGLQYKVITMGNGPKPTADDTVTVNYRGTTIDGVEFDSSYSRKEPATFPLKGVIPGWTEALQLMPVGSKFEIFLPANLAYGERGAGAKIGPNSVLKFEVELLSIKPKDAAAEPKK